jgi:hypothetical protein
MACPACGERLVTKTADRPPRLICSRCGRVLPESNLPPLLGELERHIPGLLALALLVAMPLLLLALTPWFEAPRAVEGPSRRSNPEPSRWDGRTGIVGGRINGGGDASSRRR